MPLRRRLEARKAPRQRTDDNVSNTVLMALDTTAKFYTEVSGLMTALTEKVKFSGPTASSGTKVSLRTAKSMVTERSGQLKASKSLLAPLPKTNALKGRSLRQMALKLSTKSQHRNLDLRAKSRPTRKTKRRTGKKQKKHVAQLSENLV